MADRGRLRSRALALVLAGALLANALLSAVAFVAPRVGAPLRLRGPRPTAQQAEGDDGKALDPSSVVGSAGLTVLSFALLPYVALAIYSSWNLATTGKAFEPFVLSGTLNVAGVAEGVSVVVVFGIVLWSALSFVFRSGAGLPGGPFGLFGLTESLSYVAAFLYVCANLLGGLGEELSTLKTPEQKLERAATRGASFLKDASSEAEKLTAGGKALLDEKLKEAQVEVPNVNLPDIKVPVPDIKMPDIKVPDIKVPDIKVPEVKTPDVKMPSFTMPKLPELKLPEKKTAPKPQAAPEEAEPESSKEPVAAGKDLFD